MAYHLPEQLREFVGAVGVWGDVDDILQENLANMKVRTLPSAPSRHAATGLLFGKNHHWCLFGVVFIVECRLFKHLAGLQGRA